MMTTTMEYGETELLLAVWYGLSIDRAREVVQLGRDGGLDADAIVAAVRGARAMGTTPESAVRALVDVLRHFASDA